MNAWIGPAIIAAVISSLVSAFGWYVSYRTTVGLDRYRRGEKIRDFQIALRAEIRSELYNLRFYDAETLLTAVRARYDNEPGFSVHVPHPVRHSVFEALIGELHMLPETVIDWVVLFYRQRDTIEKLVEDMRQPDFKALEPDRQLTMYEDYLRLRQVLQTLAESTIRSLDSSLNNPDGVQSAPESDLGSPEGSA